MNDHEPFIELELSQQELQELYRSAAEALVLYGDVSPANDVESIAGQPEPSRFSAQLDREKLAEWVDMDEDWFVVDGSITYTTAHATSLDPLDGALDGVVYFSVIHQSAVSTTDEGPLECTTTYRMLKAYPDGDVTGAADVEYSRGGYRISPQGFELGKPMTAENVQDVLGDLLSLERPLGADERDSLLAIAASVREQPRDA